MCCAPCVARVLVWRGASRRGAAVRRALDALAGKHVAPTTERVIVPSNPGGHWTVNVIGNAANTVCTLDPRGETTQCT